jgi:fatty acid desaturase
VLLMIIRAATKGGPWVGYEGVRLFLRRQTYGSWMAYAFRPFIQLLLATIRPWMFGYGLPPLLMNAL